ncbi:MAG: outer membrane beta-barrel protein [Bacteroidales bacterium]
MEKVKTLVILFFLTLSSSLTYSQDIIPMKATDRFMIGLFTDVWSDLPSGMDTKVINRGISIDMMQDFPLGNSNFSLGLGLGYMGQNLYSDNYLYTLFEGNYDFVEIDEEVVVEKSKLSLNYLQVPFEVRFRTRNLPENLRIHLGARAGLLINAHNKYLGGDLEGLSDKERKFKESKLGNVEQFNFGLLARVGYSRFNVFAYMPLMAVFEDNNAEDASFLSVGLTFIVF